MNNEFKKTTGKTQTVYTLESATAGGTSSGSIASVSSPMGGVRKRGDNLIAQESDKKKVPASTPRNFVAKNAKTSGAGAHTDKKKSEKQGNAKHKKPYMESLKDRLDSLKSKLSEAGYGRDSWDSNTSGWQDREQGSIDRDKRDFKRQELQHELGHERNNYAVAIDGRTWKVFADQRQAQNIARSLKAKGKNATVHETGASPTAEGVAEGSDDIKTLQIDLWNLYKDVTGNRPRSDVVDWTREQWNDPEFLKGEIAKLSQQGMAEGVRGLYHGDKGIRPPQTQPERDEIARDIKQSRATNRADQTTTGYGNRVAPQGGAASSSTSGQIGAKKTDATGQTSYSSRNADKKYANYAGNINTTAGAGKGVAEGDEPGYVKYEQMKDKISSVLIKLYKQGKDAETIKQMGGRVARHLGYDPTDSIYQDAWLTSFNDASLDGSLDQDSDDDYTDYSMRQGERGNPGRFKEQGMAEGAKWRSDPDAYDVDDEGNKTPRNPNTPKFGYDPLQRRADTANDAKTPRGKTAALKTSLKMAKGNKGVAEGLDPDTQRLEQEVRDALANGDDYTAKSLVKMAQTAADRNYLRKIIRQEMYGTGPGQGGVAEGDAYMESLDQMLERQLEPTMDLDAWNDNFQNADPQKYHQFKNKSPEKKK